MLEHFTVEGATDLQNRLRERVICEDDCPPHDVRYVAGVDVAYGKADDKCVYAGVVIMDASASQVLETSTAVLENSFPYVPGLFAFRELPSIVKAFETLSLVPDLVICDGHGIAHPRRFGLASHLGVLFDIPSIGCGKIWLTGEYEMPAEPRGSVSPLLDEHHEQIGGVVRTQDGVSPLFVSVGHRISLASAADWVLRLANRYRQPEPIRYVNTLVNTLRSSAGRNPPVVNVKIG
jgi:deoxyribonuclease V